jgi:hypothetical protein
MSTSRRTSDQAFGAEPTAPQNSDGKSCGNSGDPLARLGAELLRRAEETQPVTESAWDELMACWGIHGRPVGVQRLRAMIQNECGAKPDDSAFSRELIAQREDRRS